MLIWIIWIYSTNETQYFYIDASNCVNKHTNYVSKMTSFPLGFYSYLKVGRLHATLLIMSEPVILPASHGTDVTQKGAKQITSYSSHLEMDGQLLKVSYFLVFILHCVSLDD